MNEGAGYSEHTIFTKGKRLQLLVKLGADLSDPESEKEVILKQKWKGSYKETVVCAYDLFTKWAGIKRDKPIYKRIQKLPFIPLEREIDDLIVGCSKYVQLILRIAKETGARSVMFGSQFFKAYLRPIFFSSLSRCQNHLE